MRRRARPSEGGVRQRHSRAGHLEPLEVCAAVIPVSRSSISIQCDTGADRSHRSKRTIAYGAIDFPTLCKLVLARNWPKFSPSQRGEFEDEFKQHLSMTYGRNVDSYKNEKVQILGERPEQRDDVTVQTKILRGGSDDVAVDYRLRQSDGQWKIIDVIIEGVSLVSNFRSQFQDIVANGGPDRLLALLKEKNATGEPLQKP